MVYRHKLLFKGPNPKEFFKVIAPRIWKKNHKETTSWVLVEEEYYNTRDLPGVAQVITFFTTLFTTLFTVNRKI